jgi:hypothetical protein
LGIELLVLHPVNKNDIKKINTNLKVDIAYFLVNNVTKRVKNFVK